MTYNFALSNQWPLSCQIQCPLLCLHLTCLWLMIAITDRRHSYRVSFLVLLRYWISSFIDLFHSPFSVFVLRKFCPWRPHLLGSFLFSSKVSVTFSVTCLLKTLRSHLEPLMSVLESVFLLDLSPSFFNGFNVMGTERST